MFGEFSHYILPKNLSSALSFAVSSLVQLGVEQLMEILEIWRQLEAVWLAATT